MASTSFTSHCRLIPINLNYEDDFVELQRQRIICGWHNDRQTLQSWKEKQKEGLKSLFWITVPDFTKGGPEFTYVGHISLDAYCDPPGLDLARPDKSRMTISSFFILPEYRSLRLGRRAMQIIEQMAVMEPYGSNNCDSIALTAQSKRYVHDEGPEGRGIWERLGTLPPAFSIQEWYEKLGYVSWKEEPLYEETTVDGDVVKLWEALMVKKVQSVPSHFT